MGGGDAPAMSAGNQSMKTLHKLYTTDQIKPHKETSQPTPRTCTDKCIHGHTHAHRTTHTHTHTKKTAHTQYSSLKYQNKKKVTSVSRVAQLDADKVPKSCYHGNCKVWGTTGAFGQDSRYLQYMPNNPRKQQDVWSSSCCGMDIMETQSGKKDRTEKQWGECKGQSINERERERVCE